MSKSFAVQDLVSDTIVAHTTDNSASITLTQSAVEDRILIQTDLFSKGIRLRNDPTTTIQLLNRDLFLFATSGNSLTIASRIFDSAAEVSQSLLTVAQVRTLNPAAAVYNEFNNISLPGLDIVSRVDIVPAALGTTINSIVTTAGGSNVDGREIWIQNIGTAAGQTLTLTHLSGAGTAGGLLLGPGLADYVIPAGGGASIMFDENVTVDGLWLIRGR